MAVGKGVDRKYCQIAAEPPLFAAGGRYSCRAAHIAANAIPFPEKFW